MPQASAVAPHAVVALPANVWNFLVIAIVPGLVLAHGLNRLLLLRVAVWPAGGKSIGICSTRSALLSILTIVALGLRLLLIEQWSFGIVEVEAFRAATQPIDAGE